MCQGEPVDGILGLGEADSGNFAIELDRADLVAGLDQLDHPRVIVGSDRRGLGETVAGARLGRPRLADSSIELGDLELELSDPMAVVEELLAQMLSLTLASLADAARRRSGGRSGAALVSAR